MFKDEAFRGEFARAVFGATRRFVLLFSCRKSYHKAHFVRAAMPRILANMGLRSRCYLMNSMISSKLMASLLSVKWEVS